MMNGNGDLPAGWVWTTLGEACEVVMGQSPPSESYNTDGVGLPFYQGKAEFGDFYPVPVKWCSQPGKIADAGDVLISVRAPVGPTNLCRETSCIGRGLAAVRPQLEMPPLYWLYALRNAEARLVEKATGTTFSAISGGVLRGQPIPLAPLPEQRRIVAKIEELFTRLDASVKALRRAQAALKRYKASVLKAACEGRLVPPDPNDEPAEKLLARILAERRANWEADLVARGKDPKKANYAEPPRPDTSGLPGLPEGWCWGAWGQISEWITYGFTRPMPHVETGIPIVTAKNVIRGRIDLENTDKTTKSAYSELSEKDRPRMGDILITKDGALGRAAVVDIKSAFCINQSVAVMWLRSCPFERLYLRTVIESPFTQRRILDKARGVAIKHLSITDFGKLPLPIPPLLEQRRIVAEVERRLSVVAEVEKAVNDNLARAGRLRQAILQRAFSGRLVPQDSSDEPAEKLLERIKAGREAGGAAVQGELFGDAPRRRKAP